MKPLATTLAALCLATGLLVHPIAAQEQKVTAQRFTDPANLGDERPRVRNGRELEIDKGARGLQQMLRRLKTRGSVMNIVAHPDDEDGGMLTLYSRGLGARVADLSLTRGEGGQNAMTGDFEDALGLLRTQELLSCDRYSGIDQFFGTEVDFGFSKTKEEAFGKWTHERVLYDVVRAIRIYRPLVITSTWIGGVTDGHGHHQASGQIAQEAFVAAGDPKVFPELTAEGILPWQPLKIYARVPMQSITPQGLFDYATGQYTKARFENYVTGEVTTTAPSTDVVVHEGTPDALLSDPDGTPRSYAQFARMGLAQQKSQVGPGVRPPVAGVVDVSYHRYGTRLAKDKQKSQEQSFFDGIDTSIEGIADLAPGAPPTLRAALHEITTSIAKAESAFNANGNGEAVAAQLFAASRQVTALLDTVRGLTFPPEQQRSVLHELLVKHAQLNDTLILALGITLEAQATQPLQQIVAGEPFGVSLRLKHSGTIALPEPDHGMHFVLQGYAGPDTGHDEPVAEHREDGWNATVQVRSTTRSETRPYFHRNSIEQPYYDLDDLKLRNAPGIPPALLAIAAFDYKGVGINVLQTVNVLHTFPGGEQIAEPAQLVPPVSLTLASSSNVIPLNQVGYATTARVQNVGSKPLSGSLGIAAPRTWKPKSNRIPLAQLPPSATVDTMIELPAKTGEVAPATISGPLSRADDRLRVSISSDDGKSYSEGFRSVGYPGLISTNFYTPATDRLVSVDLKLPSARRIGYLPGTGDAVPEALASLGLTPMMLSVGDLTPDKLKDFDTVILGVRTYAAHADLHGKPTQALLDYAKAGGNVVVQYQTAEFTGDDAPYPLTLGRDAEKVVDETDPVRLIEEPNDPAQRLLVVPNRIHPDDFNGWVEERGHGFLRTWDNHYSAPTETHDPGEDLQRGGLVTTQFGKGRWTYLAFAVYRQLPEAVPGAFRLFVNLLDKP